MTTAFEFSTDGGCDTATVIFNANSLLGWLLKHFGQDYDLGAHITNGVYVNFIHDWWDVQFIFESKRRIFKRLLITNLFTVSVFARSC